MDPQTSKMRTPRNYLRSHSSRLAAAPPRFNLSLGGKCLRAGEPARVRVGRSRPRLLHDSSI